MLIKTCVKNILESGTVSLSAGTADSSYPLYRLYDRDIGKMFKITAAATLEVKIQNYIPLNTNGDIETGDWTGWVPGSLGSISNADPFRGVYSIKLTATGSSGAAGRTANIEINPNKTYRIFGRMKCATRTSGNLKYRLNEWDEDSASLGSNTLLSVATTGTYTLADKTIGPSGSGADFIFAANTKYVSLQLFTDGTTPTLTGYLDDAFIFETLTNYLSIDQLFIPSGHNLNGMTIDLKYSDDDITYTAALTQFYGYPGLIQKSFTAQQIQFWKFIITSPAVIPEIPELFLSPSYEWTRTPPRPTGSLDPLFNVERRQTAGGAVRYLVHGDPRKQRQYHMPRCVGTQKTNVSALNDAWQGSKPFYMSDHEGIWIYGELIEPLNLKEEAADKFSFDFNFLEVIPG